MEDCRASHAEEGPITRSHRCSGHRTWPWFKMRVGLCFPCALGTISYGPALYTLRNPCKIKRVTAETAVLSRSNVVYIASFLTYERPAPLHYSLFRGIVKKLTFLTALITVWVTLVYDACLQSEGFIPQGLGFPSCVFKLPLQDALVHVLYSYTSLVWLNASIEWGS